MYQCASSLKSTSRHGLMDGIDNYPHKNDEKTNETNAVAL